MPAITPYREILLLAGWPALLLTIAIGLQYRFEAAEVAAPADRAQAISLVLAGGVAGGFLGTMSALLGRDLFSRFPFSGRS